jgi:hypothetical protein
MAKGSLEEAWEGFIYSPHFTISPSSAMSETVSRTASSGTPLQLMISDHPQYIRWTQFPRK